MTTECTGAPLTLQGLDARKFVVSNDSKVNSSDGGLLLLGKLEQSKRVIERLASCFTDFRETYRIRHTVKSLLTQRIFGLVLGYEDINDHEQLRHDPLFQYICASESRELAGKSTLNRLELGKQFDLEDENRYTKISWNNQQIEDLFCQIFLESFDKAPESIILDFDATDIPLHGDQENKFFNGYYDHYCYMPLYVFCGEHLLAARLHTSDKDGCYGTLEILEKLVGQIRERFPEMRIIFRGDSGFCRGEILDLCESLKIGYVIGMARNDRLLSIIEEQRQDAQEMYESFGTASRVFTRFSYRTRTSWSRSRDVVAKAEHLSKGANPRFIVTNIEGEGKSLYEDLYCARGDMENRIKEQKLDLFASRTSTGWMSSNQLRLWFSGIAYVFFVLLKRYIPDENPHHNKMPSTLRLKLLKVAASVRISIRRVWVSLPESFPYWELWSQIAVAI